MQRLKVFFFLIYIQNLIADRNKYCEICPNHILCKYQDYGPNPSCLGYKEKSLLTQEQIETIVNQINIRRNFIALGQSTFFPAAANMKKIVWSNELAVFAQRWVDQCNQSLKPDLEDQCRDMGKTKVGQNIATITGLSPGVNVKSFVEMWFMLSMDYVGSVTYYNQSRDYKTKYFTQLIWADTDKVGCGKASFFAKHVKLILIERLVCNFAPGGNVHGKPVYTIGYPATQCDDNMIPDHIFPGLCSYDAKAAMLSSMNTAATSLLRIRNLFNDLAKQEIDPVHSNLKQITNSSKVTSFNQKEYDIPEGSYDFIKRSHPLENDNYWTGYKNNSRPLSDYFRQQEKGHSKLYYGHNRKDEFDYLHPITTFQDSGRYDFTIALKHQHDINYRKLNIKDQCTRKTSLEKNTDIASKCDCKHENFKCTRGQKTNCLFTKKITTCSESTTHPNLNNECVCGATQRSCNNINHYAQNRNCDCDLKCSSQRYAGLLKSLEDPDTESSEIYNKFHNYDLPKEETQEGKQITPYPYDVTAREFLRRLNKRKNTNSDYSEIKEHFREDNTNFKPFWQLDDFKNNKQLPLKSLLYTTLSNKKMSRSKRTKSTLKTFTTTESITIKNIDRQDKSKHITEKYLSFDELMHLRKNISSSYNIRRYNDEIPNEKEDKAILRDAPTTTEQSTSEYTANTPYIRLKHCTRKLTCTWTAASLTDSDGSIIPGGQGGNGGTRTPPGYVEGCTRTSTCTRDFMDRNKMATLPIETTSPEIDTDDEDYCERRSLNKRNSNEIELLQEYDTNLMNEKKSVINKKLNLSVFKKLPLQTNSFYGCNCTEDIVRNKRHHMNHSNTINLLNYRNIKRENLRELFRKENTVMSYGDLFYLVLNKILETWKSKSVSHSHKKCSCNNDDKIKLSYLLLFITVLAIK